MRINEVTYGKLKTPLKVNGNLGITTFVLWETIINVFDLTIIIVRNQ